MEVPHSTRVVITGVAGGIGRAVALRLAARGARVAGVDRPGTDLTALAEQIEDAGGEAMLREGDLRSTDSVDGIADDVARRWGGIDGWVNSAARLLVAPFLEMTDSDWSELLDVNLMGYVRGARAAARHMVPARTGVIVNIGSAVSTFPPTQMTAYVTAKGAITGLTRSLAVELGPSGVRVNTVAPGATETPLNAESWTEEVRETYRRRIPLRRIAEPDDIARAICLVLSEDAAYMTGQVVLVDGGLTLDGSVGHKVS